ncbi:hypothetical protein EDD18DRAFT_1332071 [Armillaria luteobubalina]|uniref:Uncharacterized protein n=1 Tax=Armillaria luteobubalina TaxID=153913 RepID=A0AA39Q4D5_9AGAR|nr:hypothetical protein EDD18DRAFT_1332071 [Armillaria luteobubalina]
MTNQDYFSSQELVEQIFLQFSKIFERMLLRVLEPPRSGSLIVIVHAAIVIALTFNTLAPVTAQEVHSMPVRFSISYPALMFQMSKVSRHYTSPSMSPTLNLMPSKRTADNFKHNFSPRSFPLKATGALLRGLFANITHAMDIFDVSCRPTGTSVGVLRGYLVTEGPPYLLLRQLEAWSSFTRQPVEFLIVVENDYSRSIPRTGERKVKMPHALHALNTLAVLVKIIELPHATRRSMPIVHNHANSSRDCRITSLDIGRGNVRACSRRWRFRAPRRYGDCRHIGCVFCTRLTIPGSGQNGPTYSIRPPPPLSHLRSWAIWLLQSPDTFHSSLDAILSHLSHRYAYGFTNRSWILTDKLVAAKRRTGSVGDVTKVILSRSTQGIDSNQSLWNSMMLDRNVTKGTLESTDIKSREGLARVCLIRSNGTYLSCNIGGRSPNIRDYFQTLEVIPKVPHTLFVYWLHNSSKHVYRRMLRFKLLHISPT